LLLKAYEWHGLLFLMAIMLCSGVGRQHFTDQLERA